MDVSASLINLFAIRFALKPADTNHSFGHGKAESLAGLGQAMFIIASAVFLTTRAFDSLRNPEPIAEFGWGISVMIISMAATVILLLIQRYAIKKTNSTALRADSLHYLTDLAANAAGGFDAANIWFPPFLDYEYLYPLAILGSVPIGADGCGTFPLPIPPSIYALLVGSALEFQTYQGPSLTDPAQHLTNPIRVAFN